MHHHESLQTTDPIDEGEVPSRVSRVKPGLLRRGGEGARRGGSAFRGRRAPRARDSVRRRTVTYVVILGAILRFSIRVPVGETKRGRRERSGASLLRIALD